jgi:hypothetical protein
MADEVIRELWRVKDAMAKRFNYDVDALAAELRRRQKESGRPVVDLSRARRTPHVDHRPSAVPNH